MHESYTEIEAAAAAAGERLLFPRRRINPENAREQSTEGRARRAYSTAARRKELYVGMCLANCSYRSLAQLLKESRSPNEWTREKGRSLFCSSRKYEIQVAMRTLAFYLIYGYILAVRSIRTCRKEALEKYKYFVQKN